MGDDPNNLPNLSAKSVGGPGISNEVPANQNKEKKVFVFSAVGDNTNVEVASRVDKSGLRRGIKDNTGRRGSAERERLLSWDNRARLRDGSYMNRRGLKEDVEEEETFEEAVEGMVEGGGLVAEDEGGGGGGRSEPWKDVNARSVERIIRRTERKLTSFDKRWKSSSFTARYEAVDEKGDLIKGGFRDISMLKAYAMMRSKMPSCRMKVDQENTVLVVTVDSQEDVPLMRSLTEVAGVKSRLISGDSSKVYWGRITGVPIEIQEDEILSVLEAAGVKEVKREKYFVSRVINGVPQRVESNSLRVRLRFESVPPEKVNLGFPEMFPVALIFGGPPQCYACHRFDHRAEECTKKSTPLCRGCGQGGHQIWECPNDPKCVNCGRRHHARHPDCPVYMRYVETGRVRQLSRMVVDNPGVVVDFSKEPALEEPTGPPSATKTAPSGAKPGLPYARVVSFKQGDVSLCQIPVPGKARKKAKTFEGAGASASLGAAAPAKPKETQASAAAKSGGSVVLRTIWDDIKKVILPHVSKFPLLAVLIPAIEGGINMFFNNGQ